MIFSGSCIWQFSFFGIGKIVNTNSLAQHFSLWRAWLCLNDFWPFQACIWFWQKTNATYKRFILSCLTWVICLIIYLKFDSLFVTNARHCSQLNFCFDFKLYIVLQSVLPGILQGDKSDSLLYGSVDNGKKISWNEDFHAKVRRVGKLVISLVVQLDLSFIHWNWICDHHIYCGWH